MTQMTANNISSKLIFMSENPTRSANIIHILHMQLPNQFVQSHVLLARNRLDRHFFYLAKGRI